jgi:preprotein translocase subunit SecE
LTETAKKPNRLQRWWRETIGELRKVSWPTPREAMRMTYIVLAVTIVTGLILGFFDLIFSRLISYLVSL